MATKVKKPPPLKKRHTKPCKFFQVGRCPYAADVCNFAHVLVVPPQGLAVGAGPLCKYYSAGQCTSEGLCGYRHVHDVNALSIQVNNMQLSPAPSISPATPFRGDYPYASSYSPYPPYYQTWPPSPYPEPSGTGAGPSRHNTCSDSPSISVSTSTSTDGNSQLDTPDGLGINVNNEFDHDDVVIVAEDPQFSEHAHPHQSQIRVLDIDPLHPGFHGISPHSAAGCPYPLSPPPPWDAPPVHYFSPVSPVPGFSGGDSKSSRTTNPPTRSSSRASSRSRTAKYKTKPCKFFNTEKGCPNGDSCTFIHDASIPPVPPVVRSHSKSPGSSGNEEENDTAATRNDKDKEKGKEGSQEGEENNKSRKKNFFPITWRVIGGGVLIGGKRAPAAASAGDTSQHSNQGAGGGGLISMTGGGIVGVGVDSDGVVKGPNPKGSRSGVLSRPRSRSTSSPAARSKTGTSRSNENLFAAESP